jgi:hypothetical protein
MRRVAFRLTDSVDPEERLEEACLFKAMSDHYGPDAVFAFKDRLCPDPDLPVFGRNLPSHMRSANPVPSRLDYWNDPAFLRHANRDFHVAAFEDASNIAESMLAVSKGVFVKSTRQKHFTMTLSPGENFREKMGDMAYSFIDGPPLMVQQLATVEYEYRFFVIDRRVVTSSPNMTALTPLDFPLPPSCVFRTPTSSSSDRLPDLVAEFTSLAQSVAEEMEYPHACIDIALINGRPGVIEFNPMQLGHLGLFACDVRALAAASETLVLSYSPEAAPSFVTQADETEFLDL